MFHCFGFSRRPLLSEKRPASTGPAQPGVPSASPPAAHLSAGCRAPAHASEAQPGSTPQPCAPVRGRFSQTRAPHHPRQRRLPPTPRRRCTRRRPSREVRQSTPRGAGGSRTHPARPFQGQPAVALRALPQAQPQAGGGDVQSIRPAAGSHLTAGGGTGPPPRGPFRLAA